MASVLGHLSGALNLTIGSNLNSSDLTREGHAFCNLFSKGLEEYGDALAIMNHNDGATLGGCFEHWARLLDAEKEMLGRRTVLMIEYEKANRFLDQSKVGKKQLVSGVDLIGARLFLVTN